MLFIYWLYYLLFLFVYGGINFGFWVMGVVGIVWVIDSLIVLVLVFFNLKSWCKLFVFCVWCGGYLFVFDLYCLGGVWVWGLLFVVVIILILMNFVVLVVCLLVLLVLLFVEMLYMNLEYFLLVLLGS